MDKGWAFKMASPPKKAWRISAQDRAGLFTEFGVFGISVPDRARSKDPFAEELYCLRSANRSMWRKYLLPDSRLGT
jgi:hypothetical protein